MVTITTIFALLSGLLVFAVFGLASVVTIACAQGAAQSREPGGQAPRYSARRRWHRYTPAVAPASVKLKAPSAFRVYQRDVNGKADIPIVLDDSIEGRQVGRRATLNRIPGNARITFNQSESKLSACRSAGRTRSHCQVKLAEIRPRRSAQLPMSSWATSGSSPGQSNMEGVGDLIDVTPPQSARSCSWGWMAAGEWPKSRCTGWSIRPTRSIRAIPAPAPRGRHSSTRRARKEPASACLSPWRWSSRPGCRSAWSPAPTAAPAWSSGTRPRKSRGATASTARCCGRSSSPAARSRACSGTRARATRWARDEAWKAYPKSFTDFIAAVRSDFGQPELPFYYVQIGRFIAGVDPKGWNAVQDAQRTLPERVPNTAVVSVIDLELDDGIHVGTQGLKRAGQRLARIALRELFGQVGATTPTLDRVTQGPEQHAGCSSSRAST